MTVARLSLRVHAITWETERIRRFELRSVHGEPLPPAEPGAHISLHLAHRLVRSYSLIEAAKAPKSYHIAVLREDSGRGGSTYLCESIRVGTILEADPPRNHFALVEDAPHSLLLAGGIGITPLLPMAEALARSGRSFQLHHFCRNADNAPFEERVAALGARASRHVPPVRGMPARRSIAELVSCSKEGAHLYCCGPPSMLDAFRAATLAHDPRRIHLESFTAHAPEAVDGGFEVELARSGLILSIGGGQSILEAVLGAGVDHPHSCREGVCGQCETRVLQGVPDHRDGVLSPAERDAGATMMICCSGARSARLVLDV